MAEKLMDVEERFQMWRFKHLSVVKRIIDSKWAQVGARGSFLQKALSLCFFRSCGMSAPSSNHEKPNNVRTWSDASGAIHVGYARTNLHYLLLNRRIHGQVPNPRDRMSRPTNVAHSRLVSQPCTSKIRAESLWSPIFGIPQHRPMMPYWQNMNL